MRAIILQHVPFEGPGNIESWLIRKEFDLVSIHVYKHDPLPSVDKTDFLIIMGGPMSVNDEDRYPWLVQEKQYIRECIRAGKPVLGICLGSQLIASALGARVYKNKEKEIGWFPVRGIEINHKSGFGFPQSFTPFHWHGETFDLPPGAIHLAKSEACSNQAYQVGKNVIALQFHLEAVPDLLSLMVFHGQNELVPAKYVQSDREILTVDQKMFEDANKIMEGILEYLAG